MLLYLPVDAFDREVFALETLLRLPFRFPGGALHPHPLARGHPPRPAPPEAGDARLSEDADALWREVTVQVRLTSHDGTSFASAALSAGAPPRSDLPHRRRHRPRITTPCTPPSSASNANAAGRLGLNQPGMAHARAAPTPPPAVDAQA
ncbi:MAG: hypothetical protein U0547_07130 [Dehalococcoidia bacterium]